MYQWTNPASGRVQLSGSPPGWYRGIEPGPRVMVFENGELVDDTLVPVTESERLALRAQAFEGDPAAAEQAAPPDEAALREALEEAAKRGIDVDAVASEFAEEQQAAETNDAVPGDEDTTAEALRALILDWDQRQLEQARTLLEQLPPAPPPPPAPVPAASGAY